MPRVPIGRRVMTVALSSMILMTATLIPLAGITGAAATNTTCQPGEGSPECWLDIRSPSSVVAGTTFTVQVAVTTDSSKSTVATSDPCGSKAAITLDVNGPSDFFASYTVNASAGIATFSLNLTTPGDYSLDANGPNGGDAPTTTASTTDCSSYFYASDFFSPLTVVLIPAGAPIAPCPPDTSCVQASSGSGTQATLIASQGSTWSPKTGGYFGPVVAGVNQCGTTAPLDPNGVLSYTLTTTDGTTTGVIILALDPRGQGVGLFNVCWTQPVPFTTNTGASATTGDLPNCRQRDQVAPCIIAKTGGSGGKVAFLTILATANIEPRLYGH